MRWLACLLLLVTPAFAKHPAPPNVLVVIADQWRYDAFGFAGNPDVQTPNLDALAKESVRCINAISPLPVCSPMRASFMTGQRPLTHGVFLNDVPLNPEAHSIARTFTKGGYDTGYIGKWHLNGDGRSAFIPVERRQGFEYWKVLECTHSYNHSEYYGDTPEKKLWEGYDAVAQTKDAQHFLQNRSQQKTPFFLVLAWGPPHDPYLTAPEKYRALYSPQKLSLKPNVPAEVEAQTRINLAGYYAHCTALDDSIGELRRTLRETGLEENTLMMFTSDHGDMMGAHGMAKKQKPWDESIRVPLLLHWPVGFGKRAREVKSLIGSEDLMPTLLGLCKLPIPSSVEGADLNKRFKGERGPENDAVVISCVAPFGEWDRRRGGKEIRGIRTERYTYVRDLKGTWLLYDNFLDPYQTNNLVGTPKASGLQQKLDRQLQKKLKEQHDEFLPAEDYIHHWGYIVDRNGTVPYDK
jgi:arylsulfatase A-like enzyme